MNNLKKFFFIGNFSHENKHADFSQQTNGVYLCGDKFAHIPYKLNPMNISHVKYLASLIVVFVTSVTCLCDIFIWLQASW